MSVKLLTIDPGAAGGLAWDGRYGVECLPMPDTLGGLRELLLELSPELIVVEKVGGYMPGNSGPAAAKFARHCGAIEGMAIGIGYPLEDVAPAKWMKAIGVPAKLSKKDRKNWIKGKMQSFYPEITITHKTADALGILYYWTERR